MERITLLCKLNVWTMKENFYFTQDFENKEIIHVFERIIIGGSPKMENVFDIQLQETKCQMLSASGYNDFCEKNCNFFDVSFHPQKIRKRMRNFKARQISNGQAKRYLEVTDLSIFKPN